MTTKPILRASSLLVALAATAFLVLHACSAAKHGVSSGDASTVQAGTGAAQNGGATATNAATTPITTTTGTTTTGTTTAPAEESAPEYFPATKAGIVLAPQKPHAAAVQHAANAAP